MDLLDDVGIEGLPKHTIESAVVSLIIGDMCYIGNVGDSRAIMSLNGGK